MKKRIAILIFALLILCISFISVAEFEIKDFWGLIDNDTLTTLNETWNVSIGKNETTTYKLFVNGSFYANSLFGDGGNLTNISGVNGIGYWNRSISTLYPYYNNDNIQINGTTRLQDTFIGDNGITDYIKINETGYLTLHGDARILNHVRVTAPSWKKGVTAPSEGQIELFPILSFDKLLDDAVYYSIIIPYRINKSSNITVSVDWCYTGIPDGGRVVWLLEYNSVFPDEPLNVGDNSITKISFGEHLPNRLIRTVFDNEIIECNAHEIMAVKLLRLGSDEFDTLDTDAHMIQVHFHFIEDKLGELI